MQLSFSLSDVADRLKSVMICTGTDLMWLRQAKVNQKKSYSEVVSCCRLQPQIRFGSIRKHFMLGEGFIKNIAKLMDYLSIKENPPPFFPLNGLLCNFSQSEPSINFQRFTIWSLPYHDRNISQSSRLNLPWLALSLAVHLLWDVDWTDWIKQSITEDLRVKMIY